MARSRHGGANSNSNALARCVQTCSADRSRYLAVAATRLLLPGYGNFQEAERTLDSMLLRRAFYYLQFGAIPILPLWLLIGRGLVVAGPGWQFVMLLFVCPILALTMIIVLGLAVARKAVRQDHALSWLDVGVLAAWYLSIIGAGFVANAGLATLVVVISVAAFWLGLWQLFTETRRRLNTALARMTAVPVGEYRASSRTHDGPRVIRIESRER